MNIERIRSFYYQRPAQPFVILTASGEGYTVRHPELMAIDAQHRWIRADKLAASDAAHRATTGVDGDPTKATPALGLIFIGYKIDAAVAQIRALAK